MALEEARSIAAAAGLNVQAVLSTARLAQTLPKTAPLVGSWPSLLLLGSTGDAMWTAMHAGPLDPEHPIDRFVDAALARIRAAIDAPTRLLWPDPTASQPFPVSLAGRAAGWGQRSRMGLTIHPVHGLWVASRGAILIDAALDEDVTPPTPSPCSDCDLCVSACPVGATGGPKGIDIQTCFTERLREGGCATSCAARLACPVGIDSRYPAAQIEHHQRFTNRAFGPRVLAERRQGPKAWSPE